MQEITISDLRFKTKMLQAKLAKGQVLVTKRGEPIAKLTPMKRKKR